MLAQDQALVDYLADTLVDIGESVPGGDSRPQAGRRRATRLQDERLYDYHNYPEDLFVQPGASARQPGRAGQVGRLGQRLRRRGLRPAALPGLLGRPGRLDQYQRLRQRLRRFPRLRLVRAGGQPGRRHAAAGDHRVRQRRHAGRHGDRQPGARPGGRVRRLLGRLLDLRLVLLSQVRHDAPVQPAGAGLPVEGGQGAVGRRALRPGDGG